MAKQPKTAPVKGAEHKDSSIHVSFERINYILMIVGVLVLILGYVLMAGGKQTGPEFNVDEIYSFRRITLAPIVIILGFVIEIVAIFYRPAAKSGE